MYPHASVTRTSHLVSLQGKKGHGCFRLLRDLKILTHINNSFFFSSVKMITYIYVSPPRGTAECFRDLGQCCQGAPSRGAACKDLVDFMTPWLSVWRIKGHLDTLGQYLQAPDSHTAMAWALLEGVWAIFLRLKQIGI